MAAPAVNTFNVPTVAIAAPPNTTMDETNTYQTTLTNTRLALVNVGIFLGLQNVIALPQIPVPPLAQGAVQAVIDAQIQHLDLYQAIIINGQIVIQNLTHNTLQPQAAVPPAQRLTLKLHKLDFDGVPREKAWAYITACQTYQTLRPTDFPNDKVFIAWALAFISNNSKAASWKAHWLTLQTNNTNAGNPQLATLLDWDTFAQEFLGKFTDPSETQRMR